MKWKRNILSLCTAFQKTSQKWSVMCEHPNIHLIPECISVSESYITWKKSCLWKNNYIQVLQTPTFICIFLKSDKHAESISVLQNRETESTDSSRVQLIHELCRGTTPSQRHIKASCRSVCVCVCVFVLLCPHALVTLQYVWKCLSSSSSTRQSTHTGVFTYCAWFDLYV